MFEQEPNPGKVALRLICAFLLSFMGAVNGLFIIGCMLGKWASEIISSERHGHTLVLHLFTHTQRQTPAGALLCDYRKLEKSEISLETHTRQKTRCFPSWRVGICFSSWTALSLTFPRTAPLCVLHACLLLKIWALSFLSQPCLLLAAKPFYY